MIFYGRRFYDPEHGRWLSPDPKGFDEGPNLYQFNRNNPFLFLDLYGEEVLFSFQDFLDAGLFGILGSQADFAQDTKTGLGHGVTASAAAMLDFANSVSPTWDLRRPPPPSFSERADTWYRETFPANTESSLYQASYWTGMIGTDILACRAGTSSLELVANSWKNASRFSETRKALDLIERFERPVYHSGIGFSEKTLNTIKEGVKSQDIKGFVDHAVNRAIYRGVKPKEILDAIKNPLKVNPIKIDHLGRPSQRLIGKSAEVVINPETKRILSVNPTSTKKSEKLLNSLNKQ